jgi:hypothetical protein
MRRCRILMTRRRRLFSKWERLCDSSMWSRKYIIYLSFVSLNFYVGNDLRQCLMFYRVCFKAATREVAAFEL